MAKPPHEPPRHPHAIERKPADVVALRPGVNGSGETATGPHGPPGGNGATPYWMHARFTGQWEGEADIEPPEGWLINHLIPQSGVGMLAGQSGLGKTFTALDLVRCVMIGDDFAGRPVDRVGGALLLAAEGPTQVRPRWEAVKKKKIGPWFAQQHEEIKPLPFKWVTEVPQLIADTAYVELMGHVMRMQQELREKHYDCDLVLVVIDTLGAAADFKDQNDAAEAQKAMNMLARVSHDSGAVILIVDHFGKDQDRGVRGSSAKEAAADFVIAVLGEKTVSGSVSNTRIAVRKLRGGATGTEVPFALQIVKMGEDEHGEAVTSATVQWLQEGDMANKRTGRPRKSLAHFMRSLDEAILDHGFMTQMPGFPQQMRVVEEKRLKEQFDKRYPPTGEEGATQTRLLSQAFRRAAKYAGDDGLIGSELIGGRVLVWKVDVTRPAAVPPVEDDEQGDTDSVQF